MTSAKRAAETALVALAVAAGSMPLGSALAWMIAGR